MRHPFDGIIIPESRPAVSPVPEGELGAANPARGPSRRSILQWFLAAGGALLGLGSGRRLRADGTSPDSKPGQDEKHRLYFVVPKDAAALTPERRKELEIRGDSLNGLKGNKEFAKTEGFLAWITPAQAQKIGKETDITTVHPIGAADIELPQPPANGPAILVVPVAPDTWQNKPAAETYQSAADVAKEWSKAFAEHKNVRVTTGKDGKVIVAFVGPVPDKVLEAIKSHPQVFAPEWQVVATTLAIGEEGGPTTKNAGEEGTRPPPRPTTRAVGEEGGPKPTTMAVGEEGGKKPITLAIGEDGGPKPVPPPGRVTTEALGEEGGNR